MSKNDFELKNDVQINDDPDSVPPSAGERILLTWMWGIGSSLLIVMFAWSCYQGLFRTLIGTLFASVCAYLTIRIAWQKTSFGGGFAIIFCISFFAMMVTAPGFIYGISICGFVICGLMFATMGRRRIRWAFPLVILVMSIAFSVSVRSFQITAAWIDEMRADVPLQKTGDRLGYETARFVGLEESLPLGEMLSVFGKGKHPGLDSDWDAIDFSWTRDHLFFGFGFDLVESHIRIPTIRQRELNHLHDDMVKEFTAMPQFGVSRMMPASLKKESVNKFELSIKSIPLQNQEKFWPATIQLSEAQRSNYLEKMKTPINTWRSFPFEVNNEQVPISFHVAASHDFLDPKFFGFTNEDRKTAGFVEHAFHYPPPGIEFNDRKWELVELQLLSLERFEKPVAYVLDNLPRMDQLNSGDVPTRALDEFELQALEKLRVGKRIVVQTETKQSEMDQMRMLGTLQNRSICMQCHSGDKQNCWAHSPTGSNHGNNKSNMQIAKLDIVVKILLSFS